jgi:hypothetical protein
MYWLSPRVRSGLLYMCGLWSVGRPRETRRAAGGQVAAVALVAPKQLLDPHQWREIYLVLEPRRWVSRQCT